jgi:hypothetical protein
MWALTRAKHAAQRRDGAQTFQLQRQAPEARQRENVLPPSPPLPLHSVATRMLSLSCIFVHMLFIYHLNVIFAIWGA